MILYHRGPSVCGLLFMTLYIWQNVSLIVLRCFNFAYVWVNFLDCEWNAFCFCLALPAPCISESCMKTKINLITLLRMIRGHKFSTYAKLSEKLKFLTPTCAYEGINVSFSKNLTYVVNRWSLRQIRPRKSFIEHFVEFSGC